MNKDKKDISPDSDVPHDAVLAKQIGPWDLYYSKSDHSLFLMTTDYHAKALKLDKDSLSDLAGLLEKYRQEMEQELVSKLETHMKEIIANDKSKELFKGFKIKLIAPEK